MKYLICLFFIVFNFATIYAQENFLNDLISQNIDSIYSYCNNKYEKTIYINKLSFPKSTKFNDKYATFIIDNYNKTSLKETLCINWKESLVSSDGSISFLYGLWEITRKRKRIFVKIGELDFSFSYKYDPKEKIWYLISMKTSGI